MERHRCKLCLRMFSNGRALGGHMRSHLAILPIPPKNNKTKHFQKPSQLGDQTESDSSSSTRSDTNPNPSLNAVGFLDDGSFVQDRESETESTQNLTRRRSKRASRSHRLSGFKKLKRELVTESGPVSSVSDTSRDEEVALCLMMLSRDVWERRVVVFSEDNSVEYTNDSVELTTQLVTRGTKLKSFGCKKKMTRKNKGVEVNYGDEQRIYECPFCEKVFGSGQALGGHKRSHLLGFGSSITNKSNVIVSSNNDNENGSNHIDKVGDTSSFILDLNLPAPMEDDEDMFL